MTQRTRIPLSHRGYGRSLSHMIDTLSDKASAEQGGDWIEVEEREPGTFVVVDDSLTVKDGDSMMAQTDLGFTEWNDEVEDLDAGWSDEASCFGMSNHLRWNDVDLTPDEFSAPSIERLIEALEHVVLCAWCPGDI
jgi:hypothetical protein